MLARANIGCDRTPTPGWRNYDNSSSVWLARNNLAYAAARMLNLLDERNMSFIDFVRKSDIRWADAAKRIPEPSGSLEVIYASHMIEHLYPSQVQSFLKEVQRVLRPGGVIRLAFSDLRFHIDDYLSTGDGDKFVCYTMLATPEAHGLIDRLRILFAGHRHQFWKYDARSAVLLLQRAGFDDVAVTPAGSTRIPNPGPLNLQERTPESLFVEGTRPFVSTAP